MAIFTSAVFTRVRKSFGNVTTCMNRGMNVLKTKVTFVNNPNTSGQRKQRLRMGKLVELSVVFASAAKLGFPRRQKGETLYNAFVRKNKDVVEVNDSLEVTVNYERLACSDGTLQVPEMSVEKKADVRELTFTHSVVEYEVDALPDDVIYAVVYEKSRNKARVYQLDKVSETQPFTITLPENWDMDQIVIYAFTLSSNKHTASQTVVVKA
ncbi:MAG: DUF6266 family protein [Odoribacter sp.]|nr:DUF6266 family protein [Odoribacter sp.]MDE6878257.1 hypothetical protein [Odoribacter sp.]